MTLMCELVMNELIMGNTGSGVKGSNLTKVHTLSRFNGGLLGWDNTDMRRT